MPSPKTIGLLIAAVCSAVALGSGYAMARRVGNYNLRNPPQLFDCRQIEDRDFAFAGRPVRLEDAADEHGRSAVRLTYGDRSVTFAVHPPVIKNFGDLGPYADWLAVVELSPLELGRIVTDEHGVAPRRLAVINRNTAGFDPDTWGSVRVKDWLFDIYELTPAGDIDRSTHQFQTRNRVSGAMETPAEVEARRELEKAGRAPPPPDQAITDVRPIAERSWQWQAALFAVPRGQVSRYRFRTDAVAGNLTTEGMGWTLPLTGFSMMGALVGMGVFLSGFVARRTV